MYFLRRTFGFSTDTPSTTAAASAGTSTDDVVKVPDQQPVEGSVGATLWSFLSSRLGGDVLVSGISLPSWLYEPLSILQRQAEMLEYGDVLSVAAECEDQVERLALVAGFAVSGYSATQRYKPNFNPLLGETFEYVDNRNNSRFFAEQVSHHPPISALHVTNEDHPWVFYQNSSPATKFLGNCIDLDTKGNSHVLLPKWGDHYAYTNPRCTRIHNVIFGTMWIEHFGTLSIKSIDDSLSCTIDFKKSGLFQGTQYQVEGYIQDKDGNRLVRLEGRWDSYLEGKWLKDTTSFKKGQTRNLWTIANDNFLNDQYNFTPYSKSLNVFEPEMKKVLLPTDSRRRLDRIYLELDETDKATFWKRTIEDRQRQDRKNRKEGETWVPVWFQKDENSGMWMYRGGYWEDRQQKIEALTEGKEVSQLLFPHLRGLACDFTSYETTTTVTPSSSSSSSSSSTALFTTTTSNTNYDADSSAEQEEATDNTALTTTDSDHKEDDTDTETELEQGWGGSSETNTTCTTDDKDCSHDGPLRLPVVVESVADPLVLLS